MRRTQSEDMVESVPKCRRVLCRKTWMSTWLHAHTHTHTDLGVRIVYEFCAYPIRTSKREVPDGEAILVNVPASCY